MGSMKIQVFTTFDSVFFSLFGFCFSILPLGCPEPATQQMGKDGATFRSPHLPLRCPGPHAHRGDEAKSRGMGQQDSCLAVNGGEGSL